MMQRVYMRSSFNKLTSFDSLPLQLARWVFSPLAGVTFTNWLSVLKKHGGSIAPVYWPRTAFTTVMAAINSAVSYREKSRYDKKIQQVKVKKPVFLIGHHRSGTTHLWNILIQDRQFAYPTVLQSVFPHTFLVFENMIHGLARRFTPGNRPQDKVKIEPDSPLEAERAICAGTFLSIQMARHFPNRRNMFKKYLTMHEATEQERKIWKKAFHKFARKLLVRHGKRSTLLFKDPDQTAKIRLILEQFPDARFIHIHRNPYRVFRSTINMEKKTIPLYAYQQPDCDELEAFVLWRYRTMYDAFFEDVGKIPKGQYAEISFSEIDREPLVAIKKMYHDIGLSGFDEARPEMEQYLASIADYQKNSYQKLPEQLKDRIIKAWHPCFERLGYSTDMSLADKYN